MQNEKLYPRFSDFEYRRRYREIRKHMKKRGFSALIFYGDSGMAGGNQANIKYVTNYKDPVSSFLFFPLKGNPSLFISNRLYLPYAKTASNIPGQTDAVDYEPGKKISEKIRQLGLEKFKIGLVGFRGILKVSMPYSVIDELRTNFKKATFDDATDILAEVRLVKSDEEMRWFRKGAALTDMAFYALEKKSKIGMSEFELASIITGSYMPSGGGAQLVFIGSTSMKKPQLIFPNQFPSHRKIKKGDIVLTELSADFEMHSGQAHRPISVGTKPEPIYKELFEVGVKTYHNILKALKPGATEKDIKQAGSVLTESGFTTFDTTFHGWGLLIEDPRIDLGGSLITRPQNQIIFKKGMLMVIQPNVVTPDGKYGLQVGNLVEVTEKGSKSLQKFPMKFMKIK
ncbi:MAG: M24 family metallopeptidase [Nitrospinota bacterium]|nr:M24 family metallopeptidase [Nitrospinota bacterium]